MYSMMNGRSVFGGLRAWPCNASQPKVLGLILSQCWMICCFTPNSRTKHWGLGAQMLILYGKIYLHAP